VGGSGRLQTICAWLASPCDSRSPFLFSAYWSCLVWSYGQIRVLGGATGMVLIVEKTTTRHAVRWWKNFASLTMYAYKNALSDAGTCAWLRHQTPRGEFVRQLRLTIQFWRVKMFECCHRIASLVFHETSTGTKTNNGSILLRDIWWF